MQQTKLMGVKHNQPESAKNEEVDELSNYLHNGISYALKIDYALEWADSKTGYSGDSLKKIINKQFYGKNKFRRNVL